MTTKHSAASQDIDVNKYLNQYKHTQLLHKYYYTLVSLFIFVWVLVEHASGGSLHARSHLTITQECCLSGDVTVLTIKTQLNSTK